MLDFPFSFPAVNEVLSIHVTQKNSVFAALELMHVLSADIPSFDGENKS
jgi:hypothetical protein